MSYQASLPGLSPVIRQTNREGATCIAQTNRKNLHRGLKKLLPHRHPSRTPADASAFAQAFEGSAIVKTATGLAALPAASLLRFRPLPAEKPLRPERDSPHGSELHREKNPMRAGRQPQIAVYRPHQTCPLRSRQQEGVLRPVQTGEGREEHHRDGQDGGHVEGERSRSRRR